ncbi:uroporphyrinogen decarboxylase family protein [Methanosphaera sp.]
MNIEDVNLKDNLINALTKNESEITPAGSFPATCMTELMEKDGVHFPTGHTDAREMATIASSAYRYVGLESMVLPFDLGFEADAIGCDVALTDHDNSSSITHAPFDSVEDFEMPDDYIHNARFPALIEATGILQEEYGDKDIPIVGAMSGPLTVLGQCLGIEGILKKLSKDYYVVEDALDEINDGLIEQIELYNELGMDAIVLYEPNGTPELVAPEIYKKLLIPFHEDLTAATDIPIVLHICGDTNAQIENMMSAGYDGISIADDVDINYAKQVREDIGADTAICGNISTTDTLFMKTPKEVEEDVTEALEKGVDVLLPSCMIAPLSPSQNIRAIVDTRNKFFEDK